MVVFGWVVGWGWMVEAEERDVMDEVGEMVSLLSLKEVRGVVLENIVLPFVCGLKEALPVVRMPVDDPCLFLRKQLHACSSSEANQSQSLVVITLPQMCTIKIEFPGNNLERHEEDDVFGVEMARQSTGRIRRS